MAKNERQEVLYFRESGNLSLTNARSSVTTPLSLAEEEIARLRAALAAYADPIPHPYGPGEHPWTVAERALKEADGGRG